MKSKDKVISIRMTEQDLQRIKHISDTYGGTVSEAVRTALVLVENSLIATERFNFERGYEPRPEGVDED